MPPPRERFVREFAPNFDDCDCLMTDAGSFEGSPLGPQNPEQVETVPGFSVRRTSFFNVEFLEFFVRKLVFQTLNFQFFIVRKH